MWPLVAVFCAAACARASSAEIFSDDAVRVFAHNDRGVRAVGDGEQSQGCLYEGVWHSAGAAVAARDPCLRCACSRGALACRRRACAPLPDPPPHRCHVLHRKGACCPELHCPDGVTIMEHSASARLEEDDYSDITLPKTTAHACVEGGTVYAAGSALGSRVACEQCFCLGGARRCVRPRCLPPPPGCRARPAPGACCPQRYYCDHAAAATHNTRPHDCDFNGKWVPEGERVVSAEESATCTQCFCLRGSVRCQPLACAPPLLGCKPLLRPGQCCPHQYECEHSQLGHHYLPPITDNALMSTRNDDRSFHPELSTKHESTTRTASTNYVTKINTQTSVATETHTTATTKVKRKTHEPPPTTSLSHKSVANTSKVPVTTTEKSSPKYTITSTTENDIISTMEDVLEKTSTEQPEGTVRVMINGTINCTAEISSTTLPLNSSLNDTMKILLETQPRVPILNKMAIETHTFDPNDIITERNANGGFDENETFVINVTSSLSTNASHSTTGPIVKETKTSLATDLPEVLNISKKTKGDYDYDYTEPTLPPSLPNLKIIPFVAADAVVDDDVPPKETLKYPVLEREDKFPVYYPNIPKEKPYATRREDLYPTKHPIFTSTKTEARYPAPVLIHEVERPSAVYPGVNDLTTSLHEYTVSVLLGNRVPEQNNPVTKEPTTSTTFEIKTPAVNLFSPPAETEGGFIPKGPGIIDEYYAVYPSTPSPPSVPHLTTSMQLDTKGECISADGRHISDGDSISLACSICTCAWGELHCSPRPCHTLSGCKRLPVSMNGRDLCCGELVCDQANATISKKQTEAENSVESVKETNKAALNKTNVSMKTEIEDTRVDDISTIKESNFNENINTTSVFNGVNFMTKNNHTVSKETENSMDITNVTVNKTNKITPSSESPMSTPLKLSSTTTSITPALSINKEVNETSNHPLEYEDDDDEEGFSLGSVLKLLLDGYDTTTTSPYRKPTTVVTTLITTPVNLRTTPKPVTTTKRQIIKPAVGSFIPMPPRYPHTPPKKIPPQTTVNRIDHLVLGEATAIKRTTLRPQTISFRPVTTSYKPVTFESSKPTTHRLSTTTKPPETTRKEDLSHQYASVTHEVSRPGPSVSSSIGGGILKLAGCNIYGRMYRVGRIITELSTPCQECRCTEIGVQCRPLDCSQEIHN